MADNSGFEQRAANYLAAASAAAREWYDGDGKWLAPSLPAITRERFWLSCALYAAGDPSFADAVVRRGDTESFGDHCYNIFDTNIATGLLVHHRDKMSADVRTKLEKLTRDGFSFKPGNRQPDYQFHGYNDNMPAKATMGLVLGGELLDDPEAVAYGLWNLRQFRAMLVRSGINSEYNSPTYSALTIHAMGEIAEFAQSAEAGALARGIEERLWIDLAARFHPETGMIAGPHSRAYTVDTIGHVSCVAALLWLVLGDVARPSPVLLIDPPDGLVAHHMGDWPFNVAQMCWYAAGRFHVPDKARELFAAKPYPFRAVATSEQGDASPDFPARRARIESYLTEDYTVATADTPFCGGEQTMNYFCTYRRTAPVMSFRDVGTVFSKMTVNDEVPGTVERPKGADGKPCTNSGEGDCVHSHANTITLQSGPTALVLTHPHLALGGPPDTTGILGRPGAKGLTALRELVIFPAHFAGVDEIMVGGAARDAWSGPVARGDWIVCRRGRALIGIRPLVYTVALGEPTIRLATHNNYQVIETTFHDGGAHVFTRAELRHVFGGFIAEHAGSDEFDSLAGFADYLAQARFTDYYWTTRRVRYRRPAGSVRPALEFESSWSPGTHTPRIAAVNGRQVDMPVVDIDGITPESLPFLDEPFTSVPSFFPWETFDVAWGEWPWAIGDRE